MNSLTTFIKFWLGGVIKITYLELQYFYKSKTITNLWQIVTYMVIKITYLELYVLLQK